MTGPTWIDLSYLGCAWVSLAIVLVSLATRSMRPANRAAAPLFGAVLTVWIARTLVAGHLPIFGAYESALSLACFSGLMLVGESRRVRRPLAWLFPGVVAGLLLHGARYEAGIWALTISERGFWVHIHAVAAYSAFGACMLLLSGALLVLGGRKIRLRGYMLLAFYLITAMIVSGSYYRFRLFGGPWSFDPIEAMNIAAWCALSTLIHVVTFRGWSADRVARWAILCVLLAIAAYRLILLFPADSSYHILDIHLRTHILP